jgi:(p)ppGpp synthase/HD superfamily hydrolase
MSLIDRAKKFAIKAHGNQKYGKMPYEYHLQQVVSKLMLWRDFDAFPITDEHIAVAWLHDTLEDTNIYYTELNDEFGYTIAASVKLLSKNYARTSTSYLPRIIEELSGIPKLVKMADTICNLEASLMGGELKRVNKYAKQLALLTE